MRCYHFRCFLDWVVFLVVQERACSDLMARSALPLARWAHCHGYSQANRLHVVNLAIAVKLNPPW
jgi:hypothetical protein